MFRRLVYACAAGYVINLAFLVWWPWYASLWAEVANWPPYVSVWGPWIVPPASWRALSWEPWMTAAEIVRLVAVVVLGSVIVWFWPQQRSYYDPAEVPVADDSNGKAVESVVADLGNSTGPVRLGRLKTCVHRLPSNLTTAAAAALLGPMKGKDRVRGIKLLQGKLALDAGDATLLDGLDEHQWSEALKVLHRRRWHFW